MLFHFLNFQKKIEKFLGSFKVFMQPLGNEEFKLWIVKPLEPNFLYTLL